eukprot:1035949-Pelagomonas_calceolata.AAC.2
MYALMRDVIRKQHTHKQSHIHTNTYTPPPTHTPYAHLTTASLLQYQGAYPTHYTSWGSGFV